MGTKSSLALKYHSDQKTFRMAPSHQMLCYPDISHYLTNQHRFFPLLTLYNYNDSWEGETEREKGSEGDRLYFVLHIVSNIVSQITKSSSL